MILRVRSDVQSLQNQLIFYCTLLSRFLEPDLANFLLLGRIESGLKILANSNLSVEAKLIQNHCWNTDFLVA